MKTESKLQNALKKEIKGNKKQKNMRVVDAIKNYCDNFGSITVRRVIKEGFSPLFLFKYPIRRAGRGRLGPNFTDRTIAQNFHSNLAIAQLHSESPEIPIHTAL